MDSIIIELINSLNIGQTALIVVALWFFYNRLDTRLGARIDKLDERIDRLDERLNERIDKLDARLNERIDKLDARIDRLDDRINKVEEKLDMKISTLYMMLFKTNIDDVCKPKTQKSKK